MPVWNQLVLDALWRSRGVVAALGVLAFVLTPSVCGAQTSTELRRQLDSAITEAQALDAPLLSPAGYAEAKRRYEAADAALRRGAPIGQVRTAVNAAIAAARQAGRAAASVRGVLGGLLSTRATLLGLDPSMAAHAGRAEALLSDAAARAEAGDRPSATQLAQQALAEYVRAGTVAIRQNKLLIARQGLEGLRVAFDAARRELESVENSLRGDRLGVPELIEADRRLGDIISMLFPPFYRVPPQTLLIDGFTLYVEAYEARSWDFQNKAITGATGTAWTSFDCSPKLAVPFPDALTVAKTFRVVNAVQDASSEISVEDARRFNPHLRSGETLMIPVPRSAATPFEMAQAIQDLLAARLKPKGDIRVHFENLTIIQGAQPDVGIVLGGHAVYPTTPPPAESARLKIAGFTLELAQLVLAPSGATATAELEFPVSIIDPGIGRPGRVPLASFAITHDCRFHQELPTQSFGPWVIGNTEMLIKGVGVTADFDTTWTPPGVAPPSAAAQPPWRGALLGSGETIPATESIVSNSGYLRARYTFATAEVTAPGLRGTFTLAAPFTFTTLQPFEYLVRVSKGTIDLRDSAVELGEFQDDRIVVPLRAVRDDAGTAVSAAYKELELDAKLDLQGKATVASRVRWGDFVTSAGPSNYYEIRDIGFSFFYIAGQYRPNYSSLDATGAFVEPGGTGAGVLVARGMQGLSLFFPLRFTALTPDTPDKKPLEFRYAEFSFNEKEASWINVSYDGVHGRLSKMIAVGGETNTDLGPTKEPFYEGNEPFRQSPTPISTGVIHSPSGLVLALPHYQILMQFVASATFESDMHGILKFPQPVDSDLEFSGMVFTSTAQIAGGKLPFTNPLKLSYWGVDMVKKPGTTSGGVLSVRTGKVLFTAAGIREPRHFEKPFYLVWGEMKADGGLQRLVFDYNSAGQRFDRFLFTTMFVRLSDYVPNAEAFLKVAGTVHFDFFGAKYLNLQDAYDPSVAGDPFNNRRIELMNDVDLGGAFVATDIQLARNWSDDLGSMSFTFGYDSFAQDGFRGTGQMGFLWVSGQMPAAIVLKAEQICMSVNDTTRHDFSLGPVAHLGAMSRITGCACLEGGELQRATLSSELEFAGGRQRGPAGRFVRPRRMDDDSERDLGRGRGRHVSDDPCRRKCSSHGPHALYRGPR